MVLDSATIHRIRAIFLHREARVTIDEAAELLGWSQREMEAAIRNGEVEVVGTGAETMIEVCEVAACAVQRWPVIAIEEALGEDAGRVLPPGLRTREVTIRLPRHQIDALAALAEDGGESVDAVLARIVDDLLDVERERLSGLVPDLAEAIAWPERVDADAASRHIALGE